jgi:hypothetical protein
MRNPSDGSRSSQKRRLSRNSSSLPENSEYRPDLFTPVAVFQFLQAGVGKAVLPEHRKGFFKHSFTAKFSRARHIHSLL